MNPGDQFYERVIPRDLFNESKLLKCLGRLCLLIHNEVCHGLTVVHETESHPGFVLAQDPSDGSFYCNNLTFKTRRGTVVHVRTALNARGQFPCYATFDEEYEEVAVFDDSGELTLEFLENIR